MVASLDSIVQKPPPLGTELQAALNLIPAYTWYAVPSGALTFLNERGGDYLGLPKDHPIRLGIETGAAWDSHIPFLHPDDHEETRRVWAECLRTGSAGQVSFRVRKIDGSYRWFLSCPEPVRDSDGTLLYWIGINLDLEEQKKVERELQDIVDTIPAIVWVAQPDGSNSYVNSRFVNYSGMTPEQTAGAAWQDAVHPDDLKKHEIKWRRAIATGEPHASELRFRGDDGEYRWHLDRGQPLRDENGNIIKWYGVVTDIEDRKRVEEALLRSEYGLAEAQRLSHVGSVGMEAVTKRIFWSDESARIYGYEPGTEPTPELILQRVHPEDVHLVKGAIERAQRGEDDFDYEHRLLMPDGSIKYIYNLAHCYRDKTGNTEVVGAIMDITERKVAEEAIRRSEAYLAEAQRLSRTGSFGWKTGTGEIVWSEESYRIFEYDGTHTPTVDSVLQRVHPDDRSEFQKVLDAAYDSGSDFEHAYRLLLPDGRVKYIHALAHVSAPGPNPEFVGAVTDITQRKLAEEGLRQSEERFRLVLESIAAQVIATTPDGELEFVNQPALDYFGKNIEQLNCWRNGDVIHPDDLAPAIAVWRDSIEKGISYDVDHRFLRHDGVYRWFHVCGRPQRDADGTIVKWYALLTDIDERKKAEEKIREQEAELRQMLEFTPQLTAVYGPNRERLYANRVALEYAGLSIDEWRQAELPGAFVHPDDRERELAYFAGAGSDGAAGQLELRLRGADGSYRWFLARYNAVRGDDGRITRWYISCTDIEDRKRSEERLQQENAALREEIDETSMFEEIVGTSPALRTVLSSISKVAPSESTVLITGETGTGKELVARATHRRSGRAARAFVSVSLAAIPHDLIPSELFGHEKGAFTGATQRRIGRFELADGGTIFLDEVGELSTDVQVALLRVLQEREIERVGGGRPIPVNVRVIAATNRDLKTAVANGTFREDLFYRLNVFPIEVPPLRERREDVRMLVEYFVRRYAKRAGKNIRSIDKKALELLHSYDWPGNIRELQNIIERSVILSSGEVFSVDGSWLSKENLTSSSPKGTLPSVNGELESRNEREIIEAALAETRGRVSGPAGAAAKLGVPPSTLDHRVKALKIDKTRFKYR